MVAFRCKKTFAEVSFCKCYENERNGVSLGSSVKCVDAFRSALT